MNSSDEGCRDSKDNPVERIVRAVERIREEAEESCNARNANTSTPKVPSWMWTIIVSLIIQSIAGAIFFGQFNGKFEEFRTAVYQRLERIERQSDEERRMRQVEENRPR